MGIAVLVAIVLAVVAIELSTAGVNALLLLGVFGVIETAVILLLRHYNPNTMNPERLLHSGIQQAHKYLKCPTLADNYALEHAISRDELDLKIRQGELRAYAYGPLLFVENKTNAQTPSA